MGETEWELSEPMTETHLWLQENVMGLLVPALHALIAKIWNSDEGVADKSVNAVEWLASYLIQSNPRYRPRPPDESSEALRSHVQEAQARGFDPSTAAQRKSELQRRVADKQVDGLRAETEAAASCALLQVIDDTIRRRDKAGSAAEEEVRRLTNLLARESERAHEATCSPV